LDLAANNSKLYCPECSKELKITYPPGFLFNQIKAECSCGFIKEASAYSYSDAEEALKEMIEEYEPENNLRSWW